MYLYIIRHGESTANVDANVFKSKIDSDIELTENGEKQATLTGIYLKKYRSKLKFDLVISSPYRRAYDTAKIICREIDYDVGDIMIMDELHEIEDGELNSTDEGTKDQQKFFSNLFEKVRDPIKVSSFAYYSETNGYDKLRKKYNAESMHDLKNRIMSCFDKIKKLENKYKKICIVTHGSIIDETLATIFKVPALGTPIRTKNCSITYCKYGKKKRVLVAKGIGHLEMKYS
jgi:broad specificity phosphatase PhoE